MVDETHIEKLAALSRISILPHERAELKKDIESILSYVERIQSVSVDDMSRLKKDLVRTIMREDGNPHETGAYTKTLLEAAPNVKSNLIEVKKIIDQTEPQ